MADLPVVECEDCGFPLSLQGRDRAGPDYICFTCTQKAIREQKAKQATPNG